MFCPKCGAQLQETDLFCPTCGQKIEASAAAQAQAAPQPQPAPQPQAAYESQPAPQPQATPQPQQQYQPYTAPQPAAPVASQQEFVARAEGAVYDMTSTDQTLRLVAFILNVISCVCVCWAIIPLAWMIPMTVISWGIYKGKKANTVAFGVCNLIFLDLISGILLLCSKKEEKLY
jgi:hypothetical protein